MEDANTDLSHPKTPWQYLRLFLTGIAMGAADIVPGVSGGTMAFILGVYENLLDGIKSVNLKVILLALRLKIKDALELVPWQFLLALGMGIGVAVLSLSRLLNHVMEDPGGKILLFAFFFGLVLASILAIGTKIRWSLPSIVSLVVGTVVALVIVSIVPAEAAHDPIHLFLAGMVAICAMILPGISGAFILLILGQYDFVLGAVSRLDVVTLGLVFAGSVVGLMMFSRFLSLMLKRFHFVTISALVGFMIGSLWKIWPWKECVLSDLDRHGEFRCLQEQNLLPEFASAEFMVAGALAVGGVLLVSLLDHMQSGSNPLISLFRRSGTTATVERAPD